MDLDLMDLDAAPSKGQSRPGRFAPKGSKFKPQPSKLKAEPVSSSDGVLPKPDSTPTAKKEELDTKPALVDCVPKSKPEKDEQSSDDVVQMDMDANAETGDKEVLDDEPMDTEDEEDEVVREIDVFRTSSTDPNSKLYVLQYPLRPIWRPYELEERCEEIRVRPTTSEFEVDLTIDFESQNYDRNAEVKMTKETLSTSWVPTPNSTGFAVGVLVGDELHLNPIHAVVQLRPSMHHLKKTTDIPPNTVKTEVKEQKPPITSRKQASTTSLSKPLATVQDKDPQESWVSLKYNGARSDILSRYFKKEMKVEGSPVQFSMKPNEYVNALCPGALVGSGKVQAPPRFSNSLPLEERFKIWLKEGPLIHRFDALKHLAPEESAEEILRVLQEHAVLVQGLWVPKSSLVYGTNEGLEPLAWGYILSLFSKSSCIKSSVLKGKAQKFVTAMKEVFGKLAVERSTLNDWKLKGNPDTKFLKLYPNIAKEQALKLETGERKVIDFLLSKGIIKHNPKHPSENSVTQNSSASSVRDKQGPRNTSGALTSTPMSEETREALPKALLKLFKTHKVSSFQQICQRLREMAVSESNRPKGNEKEAKAAARGVDGPPEELKEIIGQVAVNIHGDYFLKSSLDYPQYDELRKVVVSLFIASEPNARLRKASIVQAAKLELNRDITDQEFSKVMHELCMPDKSFWVLRRSSGNPK